MIKHDLIKEIGIEKAREIVEGAPGTATHFNISNSYFAREVLRNKDFVWAKYDKSTQSWFYDFSESHRVSLNDLRTAIAEYDSNPSNSRELDIQGMLHDIDDYFDQAECTKTPRMANNLLAQIYEQLSGEVKGDASEMEVERNG